MWASLGWCAQDCAGKPNLGFRGAVVRFGKLAAGSDRGRNATTSKSSQQENPAGQRRRSLDVLETVLASSAAKRRVLKIRRSLGDAQEQRQATLYLHQPIHIDQPEGDPTLLRFTVMALSTITCEGCSKPFSALG